MRAGDPQLRPLHLLRHPLPRPARGGGPLTVVIGLGSSFRRDDGVGPAALALLQVGLEAAPGDGAGPAVEVIALDGDPARVIEAWADADLAVVVDAVRTGAPAGTLHRLELGCESLPGAGSAPSSHALGVAEAVALGRAVDRMPRRLVVLGLEPADVGEGTGLSAPVEAALPSLVAAVAAEAGLSAAVEAAPPSLVAAEAAEPDPSGAVETAPPSLVAAEAAEPDLDRGAAAASGRAAASDRTAGAAAPLARDLVVRGTVQGVGFRPFVCRLATACGVTGWVRNSGGEVAIHAEGDGDALERFAAALSRDAPAAAAVTALTSADGVVTGAERFDINVSHGAALHGDGDGVVPRLVPADRAPCAACAAELEDASDRRAGYGFGACVDCGPRYTVIADLPYDRERTALAGFPMCEACRAEHDHPGDGPRSRRFGAETLACPRCGPAAALLDAVGRPMPTAATTTRGGGDGDAPAAADGAAVLGAAALLSDGGIVAIKGVGGYQLACDATDAAAVAELRRRKRRPDKPFAVMVADVAAARRWCDPTPAEEAALTDAAAPIVLIADRGLLADGIAPGHRRTGLLLPASPLHHLLARAVDRPIVLTSGNRSDEPIAVDDADARRRLASIADAFLTHDRPILARADDSVLVAFHKQTRPENDPFLLWKSSEGFAVLRRARGLAPSPITLDRAVPPTLAMGADLQSTVCLAAGQHAVVSPHIGDLDDVATVDAWRATVAHLRRLTGVRPELVVCDRHPDLVSSRLAEEVAAELDVPLARVQHHHAHLAAVVAEHHIDGPAVGVAFDGFGLGDDGTAWGGELMVLADGGCERVGHLATVPLPGGDLAVRYPCRMAVVHAAAAGVLDGALALLGLDPGAPDPTLSGVSARAVVEVAAADTWGVTSSTGRLFDAVATLAGVGRSPSYEGQPAMLLEQMASGAAALDLPSMDLATPRPGDQPAGVVLDPAPLVAGVVEALAVGADVGEVARGFHRALAAGVAVAVEGIARSRDIDTVVLGGGVWANQVLAADVACDLAARGLDVHRPTALPPGDGGLCLGQVRAAQAASWEAR